MKTRSSVIAQPVPVIAFDADIDFLKLPKDLYLGEVTGVAVDSRHHIFVFSRGNTTGPAYAAAARPRGRHYLYGAGIQVG